MSPTTDPLPASLARIVQRFQRQSEPKDVMNNWYGFAKRLKKFPHQIKCKVPGCVSQVYITAAMGKVWFQGDSDSAG